MFKKNNYHLQPALISTISKLPEKSLKLLKLTDLKKLYTDGGYGTPEIEKALAEEHADQVQIANHG